MKIDFSQQLKTLDGEPISETVKKNGADSELKITLAVVSSNALMAQEQSQAGDDKVKCYTLASRIHNGGEQELTIEEASFLKGKIGAHMPALVVGQAFKLIEAGSDRPTTVS